MSFVYCLQNKPAITGLSLLVEVVDIFQRAPISPPGNRFTFPPSSGQDGKRPPWNKQSIQATIIPQIIYWKRSSCHQQRSVQMRGCSRNVTSRCSGERESKLRNIAWQNRKSDRLADRRIVVVHFDFRWLFSPPLLSFHKHFRIKQTRRQNKRTE